MRYRLAVLPLSVWSGPDAADPIQTELSVCIGDARAALERLPSSPDPQGDRRRYASICRRIETLGMLLATPQHVAESELFQVLISSAGASQAIAAGPIVTPDATASAARQLQLAFGAQGDSLVDFMTTVAEAGAGLVVIAEPFLGASRELPPGAEPSPRAVSPCSAEGVEAAGTLAEARTLRQALRQHLDTALARPDARVPLGLFPDAVITQELHRAVYRAPRSTVGSITPVFSDGSVGVPFPVACREPVEPRPATIELRAALISVRHLELDGRVDFAWFRNHDVSVPRTAAETEAFCCKTTKQYLRELRAATAEDAVLQITIYQTGLPQAVVGFYRGLLETLREGVWSRSTFGVVPVFFEPWSEGRYRPGSAWV